MARDHARVLVAIWRDERFIALTPRAQRMYLLLLSQPRLSLCGQLDITVGRWARLSQGDTDDLVSADIDELERQRFILTDARTEELVIRSFVRHDGVCDSPNLIQGMWKSWVGIQSRRLRHAIVQELPDKAFESGFGSTKKDYEPPDEALSLRQEPFTEGFDEGFGNGSPTPTPSTTPSPTPGAAASSLVQHVSPPPVEAPRTWVEQLDPTGPVAVSAKATKVLDLAAARATDRPLLPSQSRTLRPVVEEALRNGYDPDDLAAAIASSPFRTRDGVLGEIGKRKQQRTSVGNRAVQAAAEWVREEPA